MAEGYQVDTAKLREMAAGMQAESDALRARRIDATNRPDVGCSSGEVADALGHLAKAGTDLAELCRLLAERLVEAGAAYDRADALAAAELDRITRGGSVR